MHIIESIQTETPRFRALRRDLHAHPELGFQEHRTSALIARHLRDWGYQVTTGIAGTGLVGTLQRGNGTRSIGIRADMDALPLQEANQFAHRSTHAGCMHACGHDGHITMLLAAAQYLSSSQSTFNGTLHLIFQPAEEGGNAGAHAMIEDGLFTRFPCDAIFGAHNWPGLPTGTIGLRPGPLMGSSNTFEIDIRGKGAHAAQPHNGTDPIQIAITLTQALQTIISRNRDPLDPAVLSVTQIHAGSAINIIPDSATIRGTVRTFSTTTLDLIEQRIKTLTANIPPAFDAHATLTFERKYPPTINDPEQTAFLTQAFTSIAGPENIINPVDPTLGAEDFAFMLQQRPGCYFFLGNGSGEHRDAGHGPGPCTLHNPSYDFNDALIPIGATLWARLAETALPA